MCTIIPNPDCYDSCMFEHERRMSIESFYWATRLCKFYNNELMCPVDKTDWDSFVDIAELLWHPRAYMYNTALELLHLKKLAEEETDAIPDELYKLIDRDMINGNREDIREAIRNKNTKAGEEDYNLITERACELWEEAESYPWRDEWEWQEIQDLLDDREYRESIDFEAFIADHPSWIEEDGMLKCRKAFSEEESGGFIPASVKVSVEDTSMTDPKIVDVLLYDDESGKSMVIELKQWTENWIEPDDDIGFMVLGRDGSEYVYMHPVIQAAFYAMLINTGEYQNLMINRRNPEHIRTLNDERHADTREMLKEEVKREIDAHIRHIIDHTPEDDPSCIPLVYLHNQYYDNGLLYELANDRASLLNDLYYGCLSRYRIGEKPLFCMYTHNKCEKMLDIIKKWFNE